RAADLDRAEADDRPRERVLAARIADPRLADRLEPERALHRGRDPRETGGAAIDDQAERALAVELGLDGEQMTRQRGGHGDRAIELGARRCRRRAPADHAAWLVGLAPPADDVHGAAG